MKEIRKLDEEGNIKNENNKDPIFAVIFVDTVDNVELDLFETFIIAIPCQVYHTILYLYLYI